MRGETIFGFWARGWVCVCMCVCVRVWNVLILLGWSNIRHHAETFLRLLLSGRPERCTCCNEKSKSCTISVWRNPTLLWNLNTSPILHQRTELLSELYNRLWNKLPSITTQPVNCRLCIKLLQCSYRNWRSSPLVRECSFIMTLNLTIPPNECIMNLGCFCSNTVQYTIVQDDRSQFMDL